MQPLCHIELCLYDISNSMIQPIRAQYLEGLWVDQSGHRVPVWRDDGHQLPDDWGPLLWLRAQHPGLSSLSPGLLCQWPGAYSSSLRGERIFKVLGKDKITKFWSKFSESLFFDVLQCNGFGGISLWNLRYWFLVRIYHLFFRLPGLSVLRDRWWPQTFNTATNCLPRKIPSGTFYEIL